MRVLILLLILIQTSYSQEICLNDISEFNEARNYLKDFLLPKDQIIYRKETGCFFLETSQQRYELLSSLLARRYQIKRSRVFSNSRCNIQIEAKRNERGEEIELGRNNRKKNITSQKTLTSSILIESSHEGKIRISNDLILVKCFHLRNGKFRFELSKSSVNFELHTSLVIKSNEWVEIANIVNEIKKKENEVSLEKGIHINRSSGNRWSIFRIRMN